MVKQKKVEVLMTEGSIVRHILAFSIPLLIGNLFQQLYNTVDSVIVGQGVGDAALAAVTSSNPLINLLIGLFAGIATGAGVIIAQYYGGKKEQKLKWAVHTAISISIVGGILLSIIGFFASSTLLRWMGTPEKIIPSSSEYLRIYFLGTLFNLVYNMGAGILRAVGDSKHPLYYLCVASATNIILDLFFVLVCQMGVTGVALATIISQAVSCCLVMRQLIKSKEGYRIIPKEIWFDKIMTGRIIQYGIPAGIQSSVVSFSNVIVQSNINSFGDIAVAGCGSYNKIDGFVLLPVMSFSMAVMTFVGQNIGAGKYERVKKGIKITCLISGIYIAVVSVFLYFGGQYIISIFSKTEEVIQAGLLMLRTLVPFYVLIGLVNILTGALRGAGKSLASMLLMVGNLCGIRMLWIFVMKPMFPSLQTVLWGYPVSWITAIITTVLYMWLGKWLVKE